ncbi:hypothetical protein BDV10DRAFT_187579 [Aspergillus recurvatus]
MERSKALQILHDHFQDKPELHALNGIAGYEELTDGALVTTQNGTTHCGHILVGADGIRTRVRQLMAEGINKRDPGLATGFIQGEAECQLGFSQYNCNLGVLEPEDALASQRVVRHVYYHDYSTVAAA